jgi:hypothetical protein
MMDAQDMEKIKSLSNFSMQYPEPLKKTTRKFLRICSRSHGECISPLLSVLLSSPSHNSKFNEVVEM